MFTLCISHTHHRACPLLETNGAATGQKGLIIQSDSRILKALHEATLSLLASYSYYIEHTVTVVLLNE